MKYFFTGIFLLFLLGNAFAQTVTRPASSTQTTTTVEQKTSSVVDEMTKVASLTTDQIEKVTQFVSELLKQKDIDLAQNKDNAELLKAAANKRKETLVNNLKTVLSADQVELLKQHWEKKSEKSVSTETQTKE